MSEAERDCLIEGVMALSEAARSAKLLSTPKAALFLGFSVSTLERRRKGGQPPPPAPNFAQRGKGKEVKYLASTLVEYVQGLPITQPVPKAEEEADAEAGTKPEVGTKPEADARQTPDPSILARNAFDFVKNALAKTGAQQYLATYGTGLNLEAEEARMPFFVNLNGLVLSPCWDEPAAMLEMFLDDNTEVEWMLWPDALAAVWQDEPTRQDWLKTADQLAPGLRERAQAIRHARLSSI